MNIIEMNADVNISQVMKTKLLTLHPKDSIERTKEIFKQYKVHHIPVVVGEKVVGIISMGDVMLWSSIQSYQVGPMISNKNNISISCVEEIMTANPVCIQKDDMLSKALELMVKYRINALPVIDDNKLVGIVTSYDFLKLLLNQIK